MSEHLPTTEVLESDATLTEPDTGLRFTNDYTGNEEDGLLQAKTINIHKAKHSIVGGERCKMVINHGNDDNARFADALEFMVVAMQKQERKITNLEVQQTQTTELLNRDKGRLINEMKEMQHRQELTDMKHSSENEILKKEQAHMQEKLAGVIVEKDSFEKKLSEMMEQCITLKERLMSSEANLNQETLERKLLMSKLEHIKLYAEDCERLTKLCQTKEDKLQEMETRFRISTEQNEEKIRTLNDEVQRSDKENLELRTKCEEQDRWNQAQNTHIERCEVERKELNAKMDSFIGKCRGLNDQLKDEWGYFMGFRQGVRKEVFSKLDDLIPPV